MNAWQRNAKTENVSRVLNMYIIRKIKLTTLGLYFHPHSEDGLLGTSRNIAKHCGTNLVNYILSAKERGLASLPC